MALVIHMHWTLLQIQVLFYHAVPCQSMSRADCEYVYICTYGPWSFCNSQRWRNPRGFLGYLGFKTQNHPNDQTKAISFWVLPRHSQPSPSSKGTKFCSQLFLETRYQVLLHSSWAACYLFWAGWVFTIGTQKPLQYESYVKRVCIYIYI